MQKSKITLLSISLLTALTFFSCASKKDIQPTSFDSYNSIEDDEVVSLEEQDNNYDDVDTISTTKKNKETKNTSSTSKNYYEEGLKDLITFGNKNKFIRPDSTSVFTSTITGSIKQQKSTINISVNEDLAGFGSTYMAAYYILLMNEESRKKLSLSYNNYLSDFSNKRLVRKSKKSFKQYGTINVTLNWGSIQSSTPSFGAGSAYLGYEFVNNSPYFVITCYPTFNQYYEIVGESTTRESMMLKYYFTKAQMSELLSMISEEKIAESLYGVIDFMDDVESDDYSDEY